MTTFFRAHSEQREQCRDSQRDLGIEDVNDSLMDELQKSLNALLNENSHSPSPKLTGLIAAVAAVIHRNGDVHDVFEYHAIEEGLKLARKQLAAVA